MGGEEGLAAVMDPGAEEVKSLNHDADFGTWTQRGVNVWFEVFGCDFHWKEECLMIPARSCSPGTLIREKRKPVSGN